MEQQPFFSPSEACLALDIPCATLDAWRCREQLVLWSDVATDDPRAPIEGFWCFADLLRVRAALDLGELVAGHGVGGLLRLLSMPWEPGSEVFDCLVLMLDPRTQELLVYFGRSLGLFKILGQARVAAIVDLRVAESRLRARIRAISRLEPVTIPDFIGPNEMSQLISKKSAEP